MKPSAKAANAAPSGRPPRASSAAPQTLARTARTASSPGFCGTASATAAIPHWARAARVDAAIPGCATHPRARRRRRPPRTARDRCRGVRRAVGSSAAAVSADASTTTSHTSSGSTRSTRMPSTVGVASNRPRGASGAEVIASVPASACSRIAPSPSGRARPAKVRASVAARASEKRSRCGIRPKLPSETAAAVRPRPPRRRLRDRRP